MYDRGFAPRNDLESARNAVAAAELEVARATQQLHAAQTAAEHATVKARFAGVVAKRYHNEGDFVNASMLDPVLRIVDPTQVQIAMTVSIQDLVQIQPGQQATVVSANGVEPATVALRPTPSDPNAATQEIRLAFASPTTLALDTPVQVEILIAERAGVVALPASAIVKDADGTPFVMVAGVDGSAHRREIRVGLTARDRIEIVTGVTPGDRVIVKDPAQVPEGTALAIDR